jgi:hypothetical protein
MEWRCEKCGGPQLAGKIRPARFCSRLCQERAKRERIKRNRIKIDPTYAERVRKLASPITSGNHFSRFNPNPAKQCIVCLYRVGFGCLTISLIVRLNKSLCVKWWRKSEHYSGRSSSRGNKLKPRQSGPLGMPTVHKLIMAEYRQEQRACERPDRLWANLNTSRTETEKQRARERMREPIHRLRASLRQRIRKVIQRQFKKGKSIHLIGCSRQQFMMHIQRQFKPGMNWNNYARLWVVDHIVPVVQFDLTTDEGQRRCFHFSNLRPLWRTENASKGDKIIPCQPELPINMAPKQNQKVLLAPSEKKVTKLTDTL